MKINEILKRKSSTSSTAANGTDTGKPKKPMSQQTKNLLQYLPLVLILLLFVLLYMPKNTELSELREVKESSQETLDQINKRIAEQSVLEEQFYAEVDQIEFNSDQWYIQPKQTLIVRMSTTPSAALTCHTIILISPIWSKRKQPIQV